MIKFILNNKTVETGLSSGLTVLDFVRYRRNLKGTKIGCREGDCGACTVMVGELAGERVKYRTQTCCLMPLANAAGKHIVTVEGINRPDGRLTDVQQALVDESGTQCGFCTVGFVMSLTNFCIDETPKNSQMAVSAIDGNICRCTGYKSIERAAVRLIDKEKGRQGDEETGRQGDEEKGRRGELEKGRQGERETNLIEKAVSHGIVPEYFSGIKNRLMALVSKNPKSQIPNPKSYIGGGTDLYVQRPDDMVNAEAENLFDNPNLRFIKEAGEFVDIGASAVVTDFLESAIMQELFPKLYEHLKLVSSTPIRNMATLAGNFVNASPIGDMTVWFLALDAEIVLSEPSAAADGLTPMTRSIPLKDLFLGYKQLAKSDDEFITKVRFRRDFTHFNFEKVCKRTYLDIATVNTAVSLRFESDEAFSRSALMASGTHALQSKGRILDAHVSAGGVAPIPLYLRETSEFLRGREISEETIAQAGEILQTEITPISDVRGSAEYKRLLARQLFRAHFSEMFDFQVLEKATRH